MPREIKVIRFDKKTKTEIWVELGDVDLTDDVYKAYRATKTFWLMPFWEVRTGDVIMVGEKYVGCQPLGHSVFYDRKTNEIESAVGAIEDGWLINAENW